MRRLVLLIAMVAAGCNGPADGDPPRDPARATPAPTQTPAPTVTSTTHASASASSNGARSVAEETDDFLFEYSYPAQAGRSPELATLIERRLEQARADLANESTKARREARDDGFPYNKHSAEIHWKVVADLPDWLSLSGDIASYSGGAHGNYGFDSLVWDKQGKRAMDGIDLFTSPAALDTALGDRLCKALNAERAKRRGEPVAPGSDEIYDKCVGTKEATVLVGSRGRRKFDRITVQFGPYVAGPYVESAYELGFTIDPAILAAVKPEYRTAFAARN